VTRGTVLHLERHVARIVRDAVLLGLGALEPEAVRAALLGLARRAFPDAEGVIRLEARAGDGGTPVLLETTRPLGPEPATWRAVLAREPHPGASPWSRAKSNARAAYERALAEAAADGADEALLADVGGFLVEGARTSLVVVLGSGALVTPPLARGAQAGIARALLLERVAELAEADVPLPELAAARELIAVNAVRGPRAIVALGGCLVGDGAAGPWAVRLTEVFWAR
jgi:branched-subunit amino acid aminotransferase/4-amino-4-deoxychorismate lyase